ncbi:MAG: copper(I)-binding protein [Gammaproteobacteria bacterium]|jgi:copper(I)-binding protein
MVREFYYVIAVLLAAIAFCASAVELDLADEAEIHLVGDIKLTDPWAKSAVGSGHTAKLFFEFRNLGEHPDRLVNVRASLASGATAFFAVGLKDGKRHLNPIDAIDIPVAKHAFELTEVGYYIELTGLEVPMLMGKRFPVELTFERAGSATVEFSARFHSPKLNRRIREAASRGDIEALKALRPSE